MAAMPENTLFAFRSEGAFAGAPTPWWPELAPARIHRYWDGRPAFYPPWHNQTVALATWDDEVVAFHFHCCYDRLAPEVDDPGKLWEGDVLEVFLRPSDFPSYYEVEVSPSGQTLSARIRQPRLDVDFGWRPRLQVNSSVDEKERVWNMALALPFADLGPARTPQLGDAWRLNLTRIAGREPRREYLAWRPTFTAGPDFHRPASFGHLIFLEEGLHGDAA